MLHIAAERGKALLDCLNQWCESSSKLTPTSCASPLEESIMQHTQRIHFSCGLAVHCLVIRKSALCSQLVALPLASKVLGTKLNISQLPPVVSDPGETCIWCD